MAKRRFQQIQEAYEVLIDSRKRQSYDLRLVHLLPVEVRAPVVQEQFDGSVSHNLYTYMGLFFGFARVGSQ